MGGPTPGMALDGGAGGIQPDLSSSAASGDATTGANSVYVGGFNPPVLPGINLNLVLLGLGIIAAWWIYKKR
ncbi:MAG: hypothetical protein R8K20_11740 [Gallionellaceae bacterium]